VTDQSLARSRLVPNPVNFLLTDENLSQWRGGRRPKPAFKSKQRQTREQSVEKITERNLLEVFNARDADSRRAAIDELWDKDGVFIDPGGVHEGVEKINAIVQLLFAQIEDYVFSVRGQDNLCMASVAFLGRMDRPPSAAYWH
jgi:hypothetical protein